VPETQPEAAAVTATPSPIEPHPKQHAAVPIALGIYLIVVAFLSGLLLIDVWSTRFAFFKLLLGVGQLTASQARVVTPLTYTVVGAVFGAVILSFQGLHLYAAVKRTFATSYGGSYLIGPWVSALIGLAAYALVKGGLLVFSSGEASSNPTSSSNWAFLALGILTGFSWLKVLQKLQSLSDQFFAVARPREQTRNSESVEEPRSDTPVN
jgi:hypothetical protein